MRCFCILFSTRGILFSYRRVRTVRGEMCADSPWPGPSADSGGGAAIAVTAIATVVCCSPHPFHRRRYVLVTVLSYTPFPRSNGSRGVPSGILLTTNTHIIFPRCRCAPLYIFIYYYIHLIHMIIHLHAMYITLLYTRRSRPPRLGHVDTKVPFIALLTYWHIASLSFAPSPGPSARPSSLGRPPPATPLPYLSRSRSAGPLRNNSTMTVYNRVLLARHLF